MKNNTMRLCTTIYREYVYVARYREDE